MSQDFVEHLRQRKLVQWALAHLAGTGVVPPRVEPVREPFACLLTLVDTRHREALRK